MKAIPFLIVFFLIISAPYCLAEKILVYRNGSDFIYGNLPDSWDALKKEDVSALAGLREQLDSQDINILGGYRFAASEKAGAMLFAFYVNPSERVSWEQRQKMFDWFKGNRDLVSDLLPENIKEFTLENIEYFQNKDTVLFESKGKVDGMELNGVNGIVFLRKGYLNIFGYVNDGSKQRLQDCYTFITTLEISPTLQYSENQHLLGEDFKWLEDHWQQILGGAIFLLVYGITFLYRDKDRLAA